MPAPPSDHRADFRGWLTFRIVTIALVAALTGWAYYDVFVFVPDFCRKDGGCIPVETLLSGPLLVLGPAVILVEVWRIVRRRRTLSLEQSTPES